MNKLAILLFLINSSVFAQTSCSCCTRAHGDFDFWLGTWVVKDNLGKEVGRNIIQKEQQNCLIRESWTASNGTTGTSTNYYNPADSTWNQLWIDASGAILELKGKAEINKMTLSSEVINAPRGAYFNRITWSLMPDGSVSQIWDILDPKDQVLFRAFYGIYSKE